MIYVHVPFCRSFCCYCDFYSEILCGKPEEGTIDRWVDGICAEISERAHEINETLSVNTLYFGGGTPSVLPLSAFYRILNALGNPSFDEFTVEVNPDDIVARGRDFVKGLTGIGVNRISMGVQSLDDGILRWMNRRHDAAGAAKAFSILRGSGIGNISVDLIFGASCMSDSLVESSLKGMLEWEPDHISAYQLSIEEGSVLAEKLRKGEYREADEQSCRRQYGLISSILAQSGFHHYEISNWAKPGKEAIHNSAYWSRSPYVGLGPGAHSLRISSDGTQVRSWNSQQTSGWRSCCEILTDENIATERIMLGLRTDLGVDAGRIDPDKASELLSESCLERVGSNLRICEDQLFVSDAIIANLL